MDIPKKSAISACVSPRPVLIERKVLAIEVLWLSQLLSEWFNIADISEILVLSGDPFPGV